MKLTIFLSIFLLTLSVTGCLGGGGSSALDYESSTNSGNNANSGNSSNSGNNANSGNSSTTTGGLQQPANKNGRLLASNCFQCHATGGLGGFDNIRGSNASEANDYRSGIANRSIMTAHAQGYTNEQWQAIITYLQQ